MRTGRWGSYFLQLKIIFYLWGHYNYSMSFWSQWLMLYSFYFELVPTRLLIERASHAAWESSVIWVSSCYWSPLMNTGYHLAGLLSNRSRCSAGVALLMNSNILTLKDQGLDRVKLKTSRSVRNSPKYLYTVLK